MKKLTGFILLEKIPKAPLFIFSLGDAEFVNPFFKEQGVIPPGDDLAIYENIDFSFCYHLDSLRKCTKSIFDKLIKNPSWGLELDDVILENAKSFMEYSSQLQKMSLSKLSDQELSKVIHDWFFKYFKDSWVSGWPAVLVDFEKNLFSNYLLDYLKQKLDNRMKLQKGQKKDKKYPASLGDIFSALTTPLEETYAQQENIALLGLLEEIKSDPRLSSIFLSDKDKKSLLSDLQRQNRLFFQKFTQHYQKYCWLPYMYIGPSWDENYFIESIRGLLRQKVSYPEEMNDLKKKKSKLRKDQEMYLRDLSIHDEHRVLFEVARRFVYSKSYRKDAMYFSCSVLEGLLREVAKRTSLSLSQVYRIFPWEIEKALEGKIDENILNQRVYTIQYSTDKGRKIYSGKEARSFFQTIAFVEQKTEKPSTVVGDCACVGKVRGKVKIINSIDDMKKMKEGDILVSYATSPDIMTAIKKSSAIVTDLGGIICHAAIVSRELHIPCVVGTKIATQVFKDDDIIEVDATHGIVRKVG
ncbi:hypothetical protein HYT52_04860 [Candidatus Woesearchaeota archaeon]|nr:hypothetical protein [Candidatus Woesearchaeota archaeon]